MNSKLSLTDLSDQLATSANIPKKDASVFLKNLFDLIEENLIEDKLVKIKGLGTFKLIWVENRRIANVNTGEIQEIPGHYKTSFTPDIEISNSVNEPYSHLETVVLDEETITDKPLNKVKVEEPTYTPISNTEIDEESATSWVQQEEQYEKPSDFQSRMDEERQIVNETPIAPSRYAEDEEDSAHEPIAVAVPPSVTEQITTKKMEKKKKGSWKYAFFVLSFVAAFIILLVVINLNQPEVKPVEPESTEIGPLVYDIPQDTVAEDTTMAQAQGEVTAQIKDKSAPQKSAIQTIDQKISTGIKIIGKEKVEPGSRLTIMAKKYYGNKIFWVYIYMANSDKIKDPNNVPTGITLDIPDNKVYGIDSADASSLARARKLSIEFQSGTKQSN